MNIFDVFVEPDSIIDPTSSYDEMVDEIKLDKKEYKNDSRGGMSISSFLKRLFE